MLWRVGKSANISLLSFFCLAKSFTGENFLAQQEANLIRSEGYKRPARGQNKVSNVLLSIFNAYNDYFRMPLGLSVELQPTVQRLTIKYRYIKLYILDSKAPLLG
jgi:hypothetical protein